MVARLSSSRAKILLFYLKYLQNERGKLSLNVTREICIYLAELLLLPHVTETFLRFFNTSTWGPQVRLHTHIRADSGSRWVELENERLFCCGGGSKSQTGELRTAWNVAYLLSRDGAVNALLHMLSARREHGVIQVLDLYSFGGCKL